MIILESIQRRSTYLIKETQVNLVAPITEHLLSMARWVVHVHAIACWRDLGVFTLPFAVATSIRLTVVKSH